MSDFYFESLSQFKKPKLLSAIRQMPTCSCCGQYRKVQAAHYSGRYSDLLGKSLARKAVDCAVAALCQECHTAFDQYKGGNDDERAAKFLLCIVRTYHFLWQSKAINVT